MTGCVRAAVVFAVGLLCVCAASADVVVFKSGDRLTGTVKTVSGGVITFDAKAVGTVKIKTDDVGSLVTDKPNDIQYVTLVHERGIVAMSNGVYTVTPDPSVAPRPLDMAKVKAVNPEESRWHGAVNLSATAYRGNTYGEEYAIFGSTTRRWDKDRLTGKFDYRFQRNGTSQDTQTKTKDRLGADGQHDHFWLPKVYSYETLSYLPDRIANLEWRWRGGIGAGYQWLENRSFASTGKWSFNQELGISYLTERYRLTADPENNYLSPRYAHHLFYYPKWNDRVKFFHNLSYLPDFSDFSVYMVNCDVGFNTQLAKAWQLVAKIEWEYNSNPGDGTKRGDARYILALGYTF